MMRIVSLVPSLTELACDLAGVYSIVGCTQFCTHPIKKLKNVQRIGGTKNPDLALIKSLNPTHILVNEEENKIEDINRLKMGYNVFTCLPKDLPSAISMIANLGEFLNQSRSAKELLTKIEKKWLVVKQGKKASFLKDKTFLYFIWRDPWMIAGHDTYISKMLEELGLVNASNNLSADSRYPTFEVEEMKKASPDLVFLSTEPWPFRQRDHFELKRIWPQVPMAFKIDGRLLSWYGSATLKCLEAFENLNLKKDWSELDKNSIMRLI